MIGSSLKYGLVAVLVLAASASARPWSEDVIYFVMTDRFYDGDVANNQPPGSDPALVDEDQQAISMYHGGDLRGLELAIRSGYFEALGVTALWITPPVRNVWRSGFDLGGPKTAYHGYWAQDFLDIDPHLTSAVSLDGTVYPDGPEGRMQHYRDFVKLAHSKGLKIVQDAVMNHAGPVFYYDVDEDGVFDIGEKGEWIQPFKDEGFHANAKWADVPKWNLKRTEPAGPRTLLGSTVRTNGILSEMDAYGRKGFSDDSLGQTNGEEVTCDFFSLRDLWTAEDGEHFDRLVDEFVEIYAFYLLDVGVDGLRIDTVKHVHHEFWDAFTERLRKRLGNQAADKILFGEVYDGSPEKLGQYTWRADAPENDEPSIDSLLAFQLCFAMREYLRKPGDEFGDPKGIEGAMKAFAEGRYPDGRYFYNRTPGPDGLNSLQKSITFIENHDGLNRFRVSGITENRHQLAQAMVMTLPGIPCLYYGAETGLYDTRGRIGQDSETGRMTLWKRDDGPVMKEVEALPSFETISRLAEVRRDEIALRDGEFRPLWSDSGSISEDDGVFAFARVMPDKARSVVVVFNASGTSAMTGGLNLEGVFPAGATLEGELLVGEGETGISEGKIRLPAGSAALYRAKEAQ
ncbi:alpha-amylase family glycosyl hydrolase [Haloferula sp.]|uniref:alpha-amylase family glycosyl hydrolase n=1 Tax=Haloferula sp. TaxID=2497595 RepID=UPI003C70B626